MYQALYRQYRPITFDDVMGQEHITRTLKNQIQNKSVSHAYLFSGTKGTGKTTTAKILSRAVNCSNPMEGNPCNECDVCRGILDGSTVDIIEMDAASNNSVDDIRELRDKVIYPPVKTEYKIYIIDEVHMLSRGAFNALLKILEEPPKHLIFILATTEKERLPKTILSRCQIFDFKRIINRDMITNMKSICQRLDISVDEKVLGLIARNSDGSMRDALSLLDQCISYMDKELKYQDALDILGIANIDLLFSMVEDIKQKNVADVLYKTDEIIQEGKDINQFIKDLIYHFRNLLMMKASLDSEDILELDEETISRYVEQAKGMDIDDILKSLDILNQCESQAKWSTQPRIILEMAIIKLVNLDNRRSLERRIEELERMVSGAAIQISKVKVKDRKKPKQIEKKAVESIPQKVNNKEIHIEDIEKEWDSILGSIRNKNIRTHAFLKEGRLISLEGNRLTVGYMEGYEFHKESMEKPNNRELAEKEISSYLHMDIALDLIIVEAETEKPEDKEKRIEEIVEFFGEDIVKIE